MKLYFDPAPALWQPERFHYAAEQMMLTLFPGEKPEYPAQPPHTVEEGLYTRFTLERAGDRGVLTVHVGQGEQQTCAQYTFPAQELEQGTEQVYHTIQYTLKLAFYQAGTALLGRQPPWGALTGVRPVKLPTRAMAAGATPEEAQHQLEEEYHVSPQKAQLAVDCAKASLAAQQSLKDKEVSLYIGIPFCPTRCAYCSFVCADVGRTLKLVPPYLDALLDEVEGIAQVMDKTGLSIRSFYIGGGTPTTLSAEQMDRLLTRCRQVLPLSSCTEYTVEAGRPDTITREKLEVLKAHDIGRISINPQTMENPVLAAIGRHHTAEDIRQAYDLARQVGFSCINMDLIAGLPRDSVAGFCRSLEEVVAMSPENITVHTLALKRGSTLMAQGGTLPTGADVAQMLDFSRQTLSAQGYLPYYLYRQKYMSGSLENVGWAKPGTQSLYNMVMMEELHTVISLGGGGVTKLIDPKNGKLLRLSNPKYPHDYLSAREKLAGQRQAIAAFYSR